MPLTITNNNNNNIRSVPNLNTIFAYVMSKNKMVVIIVTGGGLDKWLNISYTLPKNEIW